MRDSKEEKYPKKVSIFDKIRNRIRNLMGYKEGKKFIIDTPPTMRKYSDIELSDIANIEQKLKEALERNQEEGQTNHGITVDECEILLEWLVQKDRGFLAIESREGLEDDSLEGCCGLSQGIVSKLLSEMNLNPRITNVTGSIIDRNQVSNGIHSFNTVTIPIQEKDSECEERDFLIDATYRQFFLREDGEKRFIKDKEFGNRVTSSPGYWTLKLPGGESFAQEMLSKGFTELTPEAAKLYGDGFFLDFYKRKEYREKYQDGAIISIPTKSDMTTQISGEKYIEMLKDESRQQDGIDVADEDVQDWYGEILTPLGQRQKMQNESRLVLNNNSEDRNISQEKEESER